MSRKGTAKTSFSAKKSESNAYLTPERAERESNRGKVPFVIIIGLALYNAKIPLSVFEVFRFAKFYFPLCVTSASWKSTVRRHLKTKSLFKKVETLHGHLWSIDEGNIGILQENIATFTVRNCNMDKYGMKSPGKMYDQMDQPTNSTKILLNNQGNNTSPQLLKATSEETRNKTIENMATIDGNNEALRYKNHLGMDKYLLIKKNSDGSEHFVDETGQVVEIFEEPDHLKRVNFTFIDPVNIACGQCGEILHYHDFINPHLRTNHPEIFAAENSADSSIGGVTYEAWLNEKLHLDKKLFDEYALNSSKEAWQLSVPIRRRACYRRAVSNIRVNPYEMDLNELNDALQIKVEEKLGVRFPVSLLDKQHAKCGMCNSVISLNRKFEVIHIIRHINAWHAIGHPCAGTWPKYELGEQKPKLFTMQDFTIINLGRETAMNIQCSWCGEKMSQTTMAMHFSNTHFNEITLPNCALCIKEIYVNARLLSKYGADFEVKVLDDCSFKCEKLNKVYSSEMTLEKGIVSAIAKLNGCINAEYDDIELIYENVTAPNNCLVSNSKMSFGRNNKLKRTFVAPSYRQAVPVNSNYVEAITDCHWKCKLCGRNIFGAVISAGAILHYKQFHPTETEKLQYELCRARLNRISGGCMEFIHSQLLECKLCNHTYQLHKPYNICRGVRHLKLKHPSLMPENCLINKNKKQEPAVALGEVIDDPEMIARFKNEYSVDCKKIQVVYYGDDDPIFIMLGTDEHLNLKTVQEVVKSIGTDIASSNEVIVLKLDIDEEERFDFGDKPRSEENQLNSNNEIIEMDSQ